MKSADIRKSYFDFFQAKGHLIVPSAPVVPLNDPTLLFNNSGMAPFKPFFLGLAQPPSRRIADTQKCIRVSGKHNDLEETGHDTYHHTFFEMLGNWSFGDYYKKEAITWAWELITEVWKLPKERLYATIFGGDGQVPADEEAAEIWSTATTIDPSHILRCGRKDNFWMMGETGPCGPCSEIHIDLTPDASGGPLVNEGSPLVIELWNLVFIQFNAEEDGSLRELPAKHVDTGMGFERACAVIECTQGGTVFDGVVSNYDTEVFGPIIRQLEKMSGARYTKGQSTDASSIALRVCADHIRMISFSIADGALPSADGRGYVVRRLLRRAARYGRKIGLIEPFLYRLVQVLVDTMGEAFPELIEQQSKIETIIKAEEISFNHTIDRGLTLFEAEADLLSEGDTFPGSVAFKLYDTYGFPLDLTQAMARERKMNVDESGFANLMAKQRDRARAAQVKIVVAAEDRELELPPTPFSGFNRLEEHSRVSAVLHQAEHIAVVLDSTPFYAEKGGQVGDTGSLEIGGHHHRVIDTHQQEGVVFHLLQHDTVNPKIQEGASAHALVDRARRLNLERHHTATHLLHHALHEVLGKDVRQQGSLVAPDRLRFDFTHFQQVKPSELTVIEKMTNELILDNQGVSFFEIPYKEKPSAVTAFFGDKYGEVVRVVKIGGKGSGELATPSFDGYSMELCGGTHVRHTGELGYLCVTTESAIAAGVRRIEAVCGHAFFRRYQDDQDMLLSLSRQLGCSRHELDKKAAQVLDHQKELEKKLRTASQGDALSRAQELMTTKQEIAGVPTIIAMLANTNPETLRLIADALRDRLDGIAVLASVSEGKVSLLSLVSPTWTAKGLHAGHLIKHLATQVGGGGGGRPDLAQAGGKDPSQLPSALSTIESFIKIQLNH